MLGSKIHESSCENKTGAVFFFSILYLTFKCCQLMRIRPLGIVMG